MICDDGGSESHLQILFACRARSGACRGHGAVAGEGGSEESSHRPEGPGSCRGRSDHPATEGSASSGTYPQVRQAERKNSATFNWIFSIANRPFRRTRSRARRPPVLCPRPGRRRPARKPHGARTSSIPGGISFPRIWSALRRSSPARPSNVDAASAAPRRA